MLGQLLAALLAIPVSGALGGQIPSINGIVGGVPKASAPKPSVGGPSKSNSTVTAGALRVTENSGVCETTPNVYQASGYGDITANESVW